MTFRPLHDQVVLRRIRADKKTKGGIMIPDIAQKKPMEGEVVATGPGARRARRGRHARREDGDRVLFGKCSGTEIRADGGELLVLQESDLMGVVEHPPALSIQAA
jgi:chaperonin GroES